MPFFPRKNRTQNDAAAGATAEPQIPTSQRYATVAFLEYLNAATCGSPANLERYCHPRLLQWYEKQNVTVQEAKTQMKISNSASDVLIVLANPRAIKLRGENFCCRWNPCDLVRCLQLTSVFRLLLRLRHACHRCSRNNGCGQLRRKAKSKSARIISSRNARAFA